MTPRRLLGRDAADRFVRMHCVIQPFRCVLPGARSPCKSAVTEFWAPYTRLRACWVTQALVGLVVQPASQTRRLACAIKNNT